MLLLRGSLFEVDKSTKVHDNIMTKDKLPTQLNKKFQETRNEV